MDIYLLRHGDEGLSGRGNPREIVLQHSGANGVPLTELGEKQIKLATEFLIDILNEKNICRGELEIIYGESERTRNSAYIVSQELNQELYFEPFHWLTEIGQGPAADHDLDSAKDLHTKIIAQHLATKRQSEKEKLNHYYRAYPFNDSPSKREKIIEPKLLDFIQGAYEQDKKSIILVGNVGTQLLVRKILCDHSEDWFNRAFTQDQRPKHASIAHIELRKNKKPTKGNFKDKGIIFEGFKVERGNVR